MKHQKENVFLTKEMNSQNYLMLTRKGVWVSLIFVGVILTFAAVFAVSAYPKVALRDWVSPNFWLEQGVDIWLPALTIFTTVTALMVTSFQFVFGRRLPKTYQAQTFTFYTRIVRSLLGFLALVLIYACLFRFGWVEIKALTAEFGGVASALKEIIKRDNGALVAIIVGTVFFLAGLFLTYVNLRAFLLSAKWFWEHVRLSAAFDKETYRPGDELTLRVADRTSETSERPYRVHLNHVEEKWVTSKKGDKNQKEVKRIPTSVAHRDLTARELHRGVTFQLPRDAQPNDFDETTYWEVYLEEPEGYFFARFLVNLV